MENNFKNEPQKIFSVSEYIECINISLRQHKFSVKGEISELNIAPSGHVYFTIKDKEAVLQCIMWKGSYKLYNVKFEVGLKVIVAGYSKIYPKNGSFSLIADSVELVGEGELKKAYDALKKKLEEDGLFDLERKIELPEFVQKIGLITSREGAVINDFQSNLNRYGFKIIFINSLVEGQQALKDLLAAIQMMKKQDIETLVITRGGGSLESLQAFNNENLVREIADFSVPVIIGIGHDKDVPLAALAADHAVSTATAAAFLVGKSWDEAFKKIREFVNIIDVMQIHIKRVADRIETFWNETAEAFSNIINSVYQQLDLAQKTAELNDPRRQLHLGYSITRRNGKIIKKASDLRLGDLVETQFNQGNINSKVQ